MNNLNSNTLMPYLLSLLILTTSGCGFHLRGIIDLPEIYQRIYIDNRTQSNISIRLRETLAANKISLVNSPADASSIIRIHSREVERKALAIRGLEVKEYELVLNLSFTVHEPDGKQRGKLHRISNTRRYSFNNEQVLGAGNEETILLEEMSRDVVNQILRRLSKIQ
jgi:LPS-assembly lipoprotein